MFLKKVVIVGGGPAGLFAADLLLKGGLAVDLYDQKPSVGRKFLVAGHAGLNLTHSEPLPTFALKYGEQKDRFKEYLGNFSPTDLRAWCEELGVETFVGTSGRVFPKTFKAAEMLDLWLKRLKSHEQFNLFTNHSLEHIGPHKTLIFNHEGERVEVKAETALFALGGGSWSKTGSDGRWIKIFEELGLKITPLAPMNCGFDVAWSEHFKAKHETVPLKNVRISFQGERTLSEVMLTQYGIEGTGIYTLSSAIRKEIERSGSAVIELDLKPDRKPSDIKKRLLEPRGKNSIANHLRKKINLPSTATSLLKELTSQEVFIDMEQLTKSIKKLPLILLKARPLDEAISSAGGLQFDALNQELMIKNHPGFYVAGEMLDWEAPTGGYLLQGCFSTAFTAAQAILKHSTEL